LLLCLGLAGFVLDGNDWHGLHVSRRKGRKGDDLIYAKGFDTKSA